MPLREDIAGEVRTILDWDIKVREEKAKVPTKEDLNLGQTAIELTTCVLSVDMRGSSVLADNHRRKTSAKVYNAYLNAMVRLAKHNGGEVRGFAGDAILVFFRPDLPSLCDTAVRTALQMQWAAHDVIEPALKAKAYEERFKVGVGVTKGTVLVTKAGLRGDPNRSDLIWPCTAVNLAAKMGSRASDPYHIFISQEVYNGLSAGLKYRYPEALFFKGPYWDQVQFPFAEKDITIYRSSHRMSPD